MAEYLVTLGHLDPFSEVTPNAGGALTIEHLSDLKQARDLLFGGQYTVSGTTLRRVGSSDVPQRAKVTLLAMRGKLVARRAWSDPATGAYSFPGLNTVDQHFIALAEFPSNPDDPAAEDYLRPVAGVSAKTGGS